jgi:ABC-type arginine/histidine transport system permease subunit
MPQKSLDVLLAYLAHMDGQLRTAGTNTTTPGVLIDMAWRVAEAWAAKPAIQSLPLRQQAYVTAVLVGCLRAVGKAEFEGHAAAMPGVLRWVSARLDSPMPAIRRYGTHM